MDIRELQAEISQVNRDNGWKDTRPSFLESVMLLVTECSEAVEAWREHGFEDRTARVKAKPEGVGPEFADILIRLLDSCEIFGIDIEAETRRKLDYNKTRGYRHGNKRL